MWGKGLKRGARYKEKRVEPACSVLSVCVSWGRPRPRPRPPPNPPPLQGWGFSLGRQRERVGGFGPREPEETGLPWKAPPPPQGSAVAHWAAASQHHLEGGGGRFHRVKRGGVLHSRLSADGAPSRALEGSLATKLVQSQSALGFPLLQGQIQLLGGGGGGELCADHQDLSMNGQSDRSGNHPSAKLGRTLRWPGGKYGRVDR